MARPANRSSRFRQGARGRRGRALTVPNRRDAELPGADLGRIGLFRGLKRSQLERIGGLARYATFPPSTAITVLGQPGDVLYVILAGTVRIEMSSADGSAVVLAILGPGEIMGELSVVDGFGRSATAVTLEPSSFLWLDGDSFIRLLEEAPRLGYNLAQSLARRLRRSNAQRHARFALDVKGRVAFQLLELAAALGEDVDGGVHIPVRLTQGDLPDSSTRHACA